MSWAYGLDWWLSYLVPDAGDGKSDKHILLLYYFFIVLANGNAVYGLNTIVLLLIVETNTVLATCRSWKRPYQQQMTSPIVEKQGENDEKSIIIWKVTDWNTSLK